MSTFLLVIDGLGMWSNDHLSTYGILESYSNIDPSFSFPNLWELGFDKAKSGIGNLMEQLSSGVGSLEGHREMLGYISKIKYNVLADGIPVGVLDRVASISSLKFIGNEQGRGNDLLPQYWEIHYKNKSPLIYTGFDSTISMSFDESVCHIETAKQFAKNILIDLTKENIFIRKFIIREYNGSWKNKTHEIEIFIPVNFEEKVQMLGFDRVIINNKIQDIFDLTSAKVINTDNDNDCFLSLNKITEPQSNDLFFFNLGDFDYRAHIGDKDGCLTALKKIDINLGNLRKQMSKSDYLIITSDHGVSFEKSDLSFSHIRETVLLLISQKDKIYYSPRIHIGYDLIYFILSSIVQKQELEKIGFL